MTRPRPPTPAQRRAADPQSSVWVTANAGTGKTRVLADRVLCLLLAGADPESILAITFTKAAAAEMTSRIGDQLARWATTPAEELTTELTDLTGTPPSPAALTLAQGLFARVLDLPRGLGIMTIHALCGSLLRRFPLEAGVAPHFETIDDRTQGELLLEAQQAMLLRARSDQGSDLAKALELLAVTLAETSLGDAIEEIVGARTRILRARAAHGGLVGLLVAIRKALDATDRRSPAEIEAAACADGVFDVAGLAMAAAALRSSKSPTDVERGRTIALWLDAVPADRARLFGDYLGAFLTKAGDGVRKLVTKQTADHERIGRVLGMEQVRLLRVVDATRGAVIAIRTEALLRVGLAVIDAYEELKRRQAALDYDDLIERCASLLADRTARDWVLFKLDARIDHLLVDEAQDTSPSQWAIIEALTGEFFAGEGARRGRRSLFVVGDEKQSIYSFQGANLANFREVRKRILARAAAAGQAMHEEVLDRSFRSVRAVLETVDLVLATPELQASLAPDGEPRPHHSERGTEPGQVELWPLARPSEQEVPEEPWRLPDRRIEVDDPPARVARMIAEQIRGWLENGELLASARRPVRPGDIIVLLQRRGEMQELLVRALKKRRVRVAGADRLSLLEHLAVQDLLALAQVLLLPEDDLSLACLMKSPLLGLDEDDLFAVATSRGEASLLERFRSMAGSTHRLRLGKAWERLAQWLRRADFMPPFELFASVLGPDGGRERLLARLGPDALDPIEAFLAQALAYEEGHPASLQGFLHWLGMKERQLKRDLEHGQDAIRVMTVHAAKGLEAPIVILADAGPRRSARQSRLVWDEATSLPFWRAPKPERDSRTELAAQAEGERDEEENLRLLYVAITRARDRLIVTGWLPKGEGAAAKASWHGLIARGLGAHSRTERVTADLGYGITGPGLRLEIGLADMGTAPSIGAEIEPRMTEPLWLRDPAPVEPAPSRPLVPSRQGEDEPALPAIAGAEQALRRRRGITCHRLLELVPSLPPAERADAVDRYLAHTLGDLSETERLHLRDQLLALLSHPDLQAIFGPDARSEQSIVGEVGGVVVSGQIDRLHVGERELVFVDFKTAGRGAAADRPIPRAYLRQMAAYDALLAALYPGRRRRAGLVWTESLEIDWIPEDLLNTYAPARTS